MLRLNERVDGPIASPVGVNREIAQDGVNGFLASTPDEWRLKLEALIHDPDLRRRIGAAGRRTIHERYSLHVTAPRVAAVFDAALARHQAATGEGSSTKAEGQRTAVS